jgi:hypothetical protein
MTTITPRRRRRLLRLARTIVVILLLVTLAITRPWRDEPADPADLDGPWAGSDPDANILALDVGTCFDLPSTADDGDVRLVPCDGPHQAEVFHVTRLPDGDLPSTSRLLEVAEEDCSGAFDAFVGRAYAESSLDYAFYVPTPQTWIVGDRGIVCWLVAADRATMIGSMRGSGS